MNPDLWRGPVAIAHRGSRFLWPENTMEAFSGAIKMGVTHLETDLRMTADGVIVCLHDPTLNRTTDGAGTVSDLTLQEVTALDAGFRHGGSEGFPHRGRGVAVPTFEELVTSFPDAGLVVDLKADGMADELAKLISAHGLEDRIIVGSFSDRRLEELREVTEGRVATSAGPNSVRRWLVSARIGRVVNDGVRALQVPTQSRGLRVVDRRLVRVAHEAGLDVHVWTVNSPSDMHRLFDLGVDGLVTDRPDVLRQVLADRGELAP